MVMSIKVKGTQKVLAALKRAFGDWNKAPSVTVGIHQAEGMHPQADMTNAKLGAVLNYGLPEKNIPPRPWLIPGVKKGEKRYAKDFKHSIENDMNVPQAMLRIGALAKGEAQKFMTDLKTPPNAPLTIKLKGSSNPLIDTGVLRHTIDYKLVTNIPKEGGLG